MPPLDLNLESINGLRRELAELSKLKAELDTRIGEQRTLLGSARRRGLSERELEQVAGMLNSLEADRRGLAERQRELVLAVDRVADGFVRQRDPALLAESMNAGIPIALFPVRIETRYLLERELLRIRVYPDVLHVVRHAEGLTEKEQQAGREYWQARFQNKEDESERIARDLALVQGRSRTQWVIRVLTPDNIDRLGEEGVAPEFPNIQVIDSRAKETRALLLPDRWCAIGYATGRREVFRVWGKRIPDELPMSPDWLNLGDQQESLFDGERRWLVDFDAALEKGMALQVSQTEIDVGLDGRLAQPFNLMNDVLERLIVLGLEWTKDAEQTADEMADVLSAQRDSQGLGFVPLGTPTNNTEVERSGYSPVEERAAPPSPKETGQLPKEKDALEMLSHAFGLPQARLEAEGIENAHLPEQSIALHMMNILWRGTFGHYLMELWNPGGGDEKDRFIKTPTLYGLRNYAVSFLRPAGPLPVLRVGNQPYGLLPVAGKGFVDAGDSGVESGIGKVLSTLRPMWEIARQRVPLLKDGDVEKAKDILQTGPWSQAAYYRDLDLPRCTRSFPWGPGKDVLIQTLFGLFGILQHWLAEISCERLLPDPPYEPGYLAGVPWVLADENDPKSEAPNDAALKAEQNYLAQIAAALAQPPAQSDAVLDQYQSGPALLQALAAYSAKLERHDAVQAFAFATTAVADVAALSMPTLLHIEPKVETEAGFEVRTPKELASVVIPTLTGEATLGQHVAESLSIHALAPEPGPASKAALRLSDQVFNLPPPLRDMGAVQISLRYLAGRRVGELNWAFRTTLDAFSYRLDAWYTARASRRLETLRSKKPRGLYAGGFGWVEQLKRDDRPDSEGYVLAPSLGQAATAAILRSGFLTNHEQGAFNIDLSSKRTRLALDLLQGLTRDQPLAALYGYRIERGLRDKLLGKLIWPLRLAFPWRPAGVQPGDEPKEAVGARDVVDGVALLESWQKDAGATRNLLMNVEVANAAVANGTHRPFSTLSADEWNRFNQVVADVINLADAVSDLLMAEGVHQIVQGNFDRAGAAMAIVDKQSLPIEPQIARTPRGGVMYTQRMAVVCPADPDQDWPEDRRALAEPRVNAWLAHMLGPPERYRFEATVHRGDVVDAASVTVGCEELGLSALSAVLTATSVSNQRISGDADTGFRGRLVRAILAKISNPETATGLDIQPEGANPASLGLAHFEALAMSLRQLLDKMRPMTRKDLVVPQDEIEKNPPDEGEYPGVDLLELQARAAALIVDFTQLKNTLAATATADDLLASLEALDDFLASPSWPQEVAAIDATGADPAGREVRAGLARQKLNDLLKSKLEQVEAPIKLNAGQLAPTHGQLAQKAIDQIRLLLGREFPLLPLFSLNGYAAEFSASLAEQDALCVQQPWRVTGWIPQLARVREGLDRFAGALSAHEALIDFSAETDFKVVQYPHRSGQAWAALPEAWREDEGVPTDLTRVPEELHGLGPELAGFKDPNRARPSLALVLHAPGGLDPVAENDSLAGFICDEWQEAIPDRFQTAGISFHYDAPGARPPQSILLAMPPRLNQEQWHFDEVVDTVNEALDLAGLRAVRPRDLGSSLGALLPANYLPQNYTDELPSVKVLQMAREAFKQIIKERAIENVGLTLGKV